MIWLGRATPSAGRDVIDRKVRFLPLPAQATVLASIPGPACDLETFGQPNCGVRRPSPNEACTRKAAMACGEAIVCAGPSGTGLFLCSMPVWGWLARAMLPGHQNPPVSPLS